MGNIVSMFWPITSVLFSVWSYGVSFRLSLGGWTLTGKVWMHVADLHLDRFFSCKNAEPLACVWYGYSYLKNSLSQGWLNIIASFPVAGNVSVKSVIATPHAQRRQHARVAVGAVRGVSDRMMIHPFLAVLYCSPSCVTLTGSKVKVSHRLDGAQTYFYSYYRTRKTRRTRKIS